MTDIFISYSRKDQGFIQWLNRSLTSHERDVWLDQEDILPTAEWLAEVYAGIEAADNFIFVISPDSIHSQVCGWELAHAIEHHKRLIPILLRDVDHKTLPQKMREPGWEGLKPEHWKALADLNWIMFRSRSNLKTSFSTLITAIDTDIEFVHQHSSILVDALEWEAGGRKDSDTLRGDTLKEAQQWLASSVGREPQPTVLQREYIQMSHRVTRKRRAIAWSASLFAIASIVVVSVVAYFQYQDVITERLIRERKELETWSLGLAADAQTAFDRGDPGLGLNLALAAAEIPDPPLVVQQTLTDLAYRPGTMAVFEGSLGRFGANENTILLAADNSLIVWDLESQAERNRFEVSAPILDFDVTLDGQKAILALENENVQEIDLTSGDIFEYGQGMPPVAYGASGTTFVHVIEDCPPEEICFRIPVLRNLDGDVIQRFPAKSNVSDLSYNENKSLLLVGWGNGSMQLWNTASGEVLKTLIWFEATDAVFPELNPERCLLEGDALTSVALSADGRYAAYGMHGFFPYAVQVCQEEDILVWDLENGKTVGRLSGHNPDYGVQSLAFDPKGDTIISGGGNELFLWDRKSRRQIQQLSGFADSADRMTLITDVIFSPTGRYALSAGSDGTVRLWDVAPGSEMLRLYIGENLTGTLIQALGLNAAGDQALVGGYGTVRAYPATALLDLNIGEWVSGFDYHGDVYQLAFLPDERYALECAGEGLFLVEVATGEIIQTIGSPDLPNYGFSRDLPQPVFALGPEGQTVFLQGCLHDVFSGENIGCYDFGDRGLFSPDGSRLISTRDRSLVVWDPNTGVEYNQFELETTLGPMLALTPDGQQLLAGVESDLILIDLQSGAIVHRYQGHTGPVLSGGISPDGQTILSGSMDQTLRFWDLNSETELRRETHDGIVTGVAFSQDGSTAVSTSFDGTLVRWRLASTLDQLLAWVQANRDLPELTCYEKEIYDLQPLCKPKDYAWFGVVAANQAGKVVVESFEPGSPAEQAGLEIGDLIYWLGDHYMESADQIYKLLDNYQPGNQIVVSGFRSSSGESFEIEVTLSQRPE